MNGDNRSIRGSEELGQETLINCPTCSLIDQRDIYPHNKLTDGVQTSPRNSKDVSKRFAPFSKRRQAGLKKKQASADNQFPFITEDHPQLVSTCLHTANSGLEARK